jgi:hypothetical protein
MTKPQPHPREYDPAIADQILDAVAAGQTITSICSKDGFPNRHTFHGWCRHDAELREKYRVAIELRGASAVDDLMEVNALVRAGKLPPQEAGIISSNLKWQAAREYPQRYGDKIATELTGKDGAPLIPHHAETTDLELARFVAHILNRGAQAAETLAAAGIGVDDALLLTDGGSDEN